MNVYLAGLNKVGSWTQEYLSQPKDREKSRTLEKTGRRNKRSLGRDVAPPPSILRLLSVPGGHSMMCVPLCTSLLTFLTLAGLLCPVY